MVKAFALWLWENLPSTNTPLGKTLLNKLNVAVDEIDNRVVSMDSTKANQSDLLTAIGNVTFDEATGKLTFTRKNGATIVIDTNLEKLAVNLDFDYENQRFILYLADGTEKYIDAKSLVMQSEFVESGTVHWTVSSDGKVQADIKKGSITDEMLESNYLAKITQQADRATTSANDAKFSADSAKASADEAETQATNANGSAEIAKSYSDSANSALEEVNKKLELATFNLDDDGNLVYTDTSSYNFSVDNDGMLNYSVA